MVLFIIAVTWSLSILLDAGHHWIPGEHTYEPPPGLHEVMMVMAGWLFASRRWRDDEELFSGSS